MRQYYEFPQSKQWYELNKIKIVIIAHLIVLASLPARFQESEAYTND